MRYLADRLRAYWLVDLVGSYQPEHRHIPLQLWRIEVGQDQTALVTMAEDVGRPPLVSQRLPYTDFALPDFSFYCVGGRDRVMMLRSEY